MKLEDQICSLELSKKLKELGIKQESLFYYQNEPYNNGEDDVVVKIKNESINNLLNSYDINDNHELYSAFTPSELLEILPKVVNINSAFSYRFNMTQSLYVENADHVKIIKNFIINYVNDCISPNVKKEDGIYKWPTVYMNLMHHNIFDSNLANACAKMLIYLIENKLYDPNERPNLFMRPES